MNYSYDNRYLFEVNGRYDGSSKFPDNSQWGFSLRLRQHGVSRKRSSGK
ncbi:hypothetical protein SFC43_14540 [Bacteroides sp. CR5/BHMF/2]|nr:hypothetical protein [Bacteroides sp. CR5/BHMF/2]